MSNFKKELKNGTYSLCGKTVAISGATGGLGRELCFRSAKLGARLVLLDRNQKKSLALIEELKDKYSELDARHITLDLEDMERVKEVCEMLQVEEIDFLVLNAGAYSIPRHACSTGYDNVYQINFVSPYYLLRRLLPMLRQRGGGVVVVGSIAHNYSKIDIADVDFATRKAASKVYGNAKRYLMFAAMEQGRVHGGVSITHPGIAVTNITAHYPKLLYAIIKYPMKIIFMNAQKASLSVQKGLFERTEPFEWIGPRVFGVWGLPKKSKLKSCDEAEAEQICRIADEVYRKL